MWLTLPTKPNRQDCRNTVQSKLHSRKRECFRNKRYGPTVQACVSRHPGLGCAHARHLVRDLPVWPGCDLALGCPGSQLPAECPAHPRQELHELSSTRFKTV